MTARREFLVQLSTGAAVVFCLGCADCSANSRIRVALDAILPSGAIRVGRAYLKERIENAEPRSSVEQLLGLQAWTDLSPDALRSRIRDAVRRDFLEGRTRSLRGWVLSETELELCARFAEAS